MYTHIHKHIHIHTYIHTHTWAYLTMTAVWFRTTVGVTRMGGAKMGAPGESESAAKQIKACMQACTGACMADNVHALEGLVQPQAYRPG